MKVAVMGAGMRHASDAASTIRLLEKLGIANSMWQMTGIFGSMGLVFLLLRAHDCMLFELANILLVIIYGRFNGV